MADLETTPTTYHDAPCFGAGLTELEVRHFQRILRDCGPEVSLPEAWSRAIELLSIIELLVGGQGTTANDPQPAPGFAHPPS